MSNKVKNPDTAGDPLKYEYIIPKQDAEHTEMKPGDVIVERDTEMKPGDVMVERWELNQTIRMTDNAKMECAKYEVIAKEMQKDEERFDTLLREDGREGMENLIGWLHTTDFYRAPASTKFHMSRPGGLLRHSLNVYDCFTDFVRMMPGLSREMRDIYMYEAKVMCLLHDLCKIGCYEYNQEKKTYSFDERVHFGGHGSKSLYLAMRYISLNGEEASAINGHMGFSDAADSRYIWQLYENNLAAWMLHAADEMATFVVETKDEERLAAETVRLGLYKQLS